MRRAAVAGTLAAALAVAGCTRTPGAGLGDAARGSFVIGQAQCGSCHAIPGIVNADGMAGPPLAGFARRSIIAGVMANPPADLVGWLRAPQSRVPGNAMPDMGLSDQQARDVAAYLYTLQ